MTLSCATNSAPLAMQAGARGAAASLAVAFDEVSLRFAERTAVSMGTEQMTYAALQQAAAGVAAALVARGVGRGSFVAIYLPRSVDVVVAMLGVIKAGAAYLPIDPGYPAARVRETLEDASPVLVITEAGLASGVADADTHVALMCELRGADGFAPAQADAAAEDLAYIIYTSGSTGRPKGVMVTHHNVLRLLSATEPWFGFNEQDVWTMFHSFAFDFSVWEMWGCLLTGGRLVIVPFEVSRSPEDFMVLLSREGVTVLNQTPSAFSLLTQLAAPVAELPLALRYVIFGGEALNLRSLMPWIVRHGDAAPQLINMYGITETTVHVTYRRIYAADAELETDSLIGEPIPDLEIHLLDAALQPVAAGEVGELCIGGEGVALGYLHRAELTAERFIPHPSGEPNARLYRSGDLARRRADGELVYLGRADHQVKINGFRIELGEVEAALAACPSVTQVCVLAQEDVPGSQRLVAYFIANDAKVEPKVLSRFLTERLPAHMRPALYVQVEAMPLTSNGKIDRKALPRPGAQQPQARIAAGATAEARVAAVWAVVLGSERIAADDNFFDIGGTSLRLVAARAALQQEFGVSIPVTWMFEHTTVRALAAKLTEGTRDTTPPTTAVQDKARQQREAFARMRAMRSMAS